MWPFPEGHTCRVCKRVLCSVEGREQHEREAHPPTVRCPICQASHYDELEVLNHLEIHLPLVCGYPRCGCYIGTKLELLHHKAFEYLQTLPSISCIALEPSTSSAKNEQATRAAGPIIHFEKSPMCTPKRRYPMESPSSSAGPKTPLTRVAAQRSYLTPVLSSLRLDISPVSPLFRSCIDEDELMVTAMDSTPMHFHTPN